jgi:hypothetical protein
VFRASIDCELCNLAETQSSASEMNALWNSKKKKFSMIKIKILTQMTCLWALFIRQGQVTCSV